MPIISYKFCDGTISEIEVSEELFTISNNIDKQIENSDRRETRRHNSLNELADRKDTEIADMRVNIEDDFVKNEDFMVKLEKVLTSEQIELIEKVFFEGQKAQEIADKEGVGKQAISNRLARIYKKLEKVLR